MDDQRTGMGAGGLGDEQLIGLLAEALRDAEPVPAAVTELARESFVLRSLDTELAELTADSASPDGDPAALVLRAAGDADVRALTFESERLAIDLEIVPAGRMRRIVGQLIPPGPGRVCVRRPAGGPGGPVARDCADVDERGRFTLEVHPGPARIECERAGEPTVTTEWTALG